MQSEKNINNNEASVKDVVERIFSSRKITRADQRRFMAALMSKDALTTEEHDQINRVFDGLRRGILRVVD